MHAQCNTRKQRAHIASHRFCFTPAVGTGQLVAAPHHEGHLVDARRPLQGGEAPSHSLRVHRQQLYPQRQQPQDQGTQEEAKIALYPVSLCLSSLHSFCGREHLDVCACTFTCTALEHNQIAMKIRTTKNTSKRYHRLFMKICTPENNPLYGMHV